MEERYKIHALFPTPVLAARIPEEFSSVIPFLRSQEFSTESDHNNYGLRSKDSYILDKEPCKKLSAYILDLVEIFAKSVLDLDYPAFRFGQSWITIKQPGQQHVTHTHPNSVISGVFYYGPPADNVPAICFHHDVAYSGINTIFLKEKRPLESVFAQKTFYFKFEPGTLLIFPSWLKHSVPPNNSERIREGVAFNAVPSMGLGDEACLTELLYIK